MKYSIEMTDIKDINKFRNDLFKLLDKYVNGKWCFEQEE